MKDYFIAVAGSLCLIVGIILISTAVSQEGTQELESLFGALFTTIAYMMIYISRS